MKNGVCYRQHYFTILDLLGAWWSDWRPWVTLIFGIAVLIGVSYIGYLASIPKPLPYGQCVHYKSPLYEFDSKYVFRISESGYYEVQLDGVVVGLSPADTKVTTVECTQ